MAIGQVGIGLAAKIANIASREHLTNGVEPWSADVATPLCWKQGAEVSQYKSSKQAVSNS